MNIFEILGPVSSNLLHSTLLYPALLCSTLLYAALFCSTLLCDTLLSSVYSSDSSPLLFCSTLLCRLYFTQPCSALPNSAQFYSSLLHFTVLYLLCRLISLLSSLSYSSLSAMLYSAQLWSTLFCFALLWRCFNLLCSILLYSTRIYSILLAILNQPGAAPMPGWISSTTYIFAGLALQKLQGRVTGTVPDLLGPLALHRQRICLE